MACEGYEHGNRVVLRKPIDKAEIPVGAEGKVAKVHVDHHELDVDFDEFGSLKNLDAHCFALVEEPEPSPVLRM